jgi:hypothetical protein
MEAAVVPKAAVRDWDALGDDNRVGREWAAEVEPAERSDDPEAYRAGAGEQDEVSAALGRWDPAPGYSGMRRRAQWE